MSRPHTLVALVVAVFSLAGCGGLNTFDQAQVLAISPVETSPGEQITVYGVGFDHGAAPTVSFNGIDYIAPTSWSETRIHVVVPQGTVSGNFYVQAGGATTSGTPFTIGTRVTVNEIEPNDAADNSNATAAGTNRVVAGNLSSASDVDTFSFTGLQNTNYRLTVSPTLPVVLRVDGVIVPLDSNGQADLSSTLATTNISLTGATGSYTVTITPID